MPIENGKNNSILEQFRDPEYWIDLCCNDLYFLCRCILQTLEDPTPGYKDLYYDTHKTVCSFVENYAKPGNKLLILTPRGWIKSYLVTIGWSIQRLFRNFRAGRQELGIISNATIANAENFLKKIKYNFEYNELLKGFFSDYIPKNLDKEARWTMGEIELRGCSIETGSVEGNLVSRHYGVMINDDLVNRENSQTAEGIAKVIDWWKLAQSLLNPDGIEINIGTRWNYDDLYGHIIQKFVQPPKDYYKGKPIAEVHNGKYHLLQMDCWADPDNETGSTFPTLFPEKKLKQIFIEQGDRAFGQYRNDPLARGKNPIKGEWFKRYEPAEVPGQRYTLFLIDPTGKAKDTSDFTGLVMVDLCSDKKGYVRKAYRERITDMELAERIIEESMAYQPDTIVIEDNKFGAIQDILELMIPQKLRKEEIPEKYREYVRRIPYIMQESSSHGRPKEVRIRNLSGRIQSHDFLFPFTGAEDLEEELIRFPTSNLDDVADAFAYVLDFMIFPKESDPVKTLMLPPELKMTEEEKEKEEWESLREQAYLNGYDEDMYDELF